MALSGSFYHPQAIGTNLKNKNNKGEIVDFEKIPSLSSFFARNLKLFLFRNRCRVEEK